MCVLLTAIGGILFFAVNMLLLGSTLTAFHISNGQRYSAVDVVVLEREPD